MSRQTLAGQIVEAQRQVLRELIGATLGDLLEVDLSMAQVKALAVLERHPDCTVGKLSERLQVKPSATSLLVDKLERAGLASRLRDRIDGRRVIVRPTATGTQLIRRVRQGGDSLLEAWVSRLNDDDLAALHRGSRALAALAISAPTTTQVGAASETG